jgi:hypothetical protein
LKNKIEYHPPQQFLGFENKFILYGITFVSGVKLLSVMEYFLSNSMAKKKKKSIIFQHKLEEKVELH